MEKPFIDSMLQLVYEYKFALIQKINETTVRTIKWLASRIYQMSYHFTSSCQRTYRQSARLCTIRIDVGIGHTQRVKGCLPHAPNDSCHDQNSEWTHISFGLTSGTVLTGPVRVAHRDVTSVSNLARVEVRRPVDGVRKRLEEKSRGAQKAAYSENTWVVPVLRQETNQESRDCAHVEIRRRKEANVHTAQTELFLDLRDDSV